MRQSDFSTQVTDAHHSFSCGAFFAGEPSGAKGRLTGMTQTRSSLLHRLRNPADQESWQEFYALYEPLLMAYVCKKGLQEHDARDVVQEIFTKLHRVLPDFELNRARGRFRTWLWQVTSNAIADWARARKRQAREEDAYRDRLGATPDAAEEPDNEWTDSYRQRILEVVL